MVNAGSVEVRPLTGSHCKEHGEAEQGEHMFWLLSPLTLKLWLLPPTSQTQQWALSRAEEDEYGIINMVHKAVLGWISKKGQRYCVCLWIVTELLAQKRRITGKNETVL